MRCAQVETLAAKEAARQAAALRECVRVLVKTGYKVHVITSEGERPYVKVSKEVEI